MICKYVMIRELAIIGSDDFDDYELLCKEVLLLDLSSEVVIVTMDRSVGVDLLVARFVHDYGMDLCCVKPDYVRYGDKALYMQVYDVICRSMYVLVLYDGKSSLLRFAVDVSPKYKTKVIKVS